MIQSPNGHKRAVIYDRGSTSKQKDNWSRDDAERIGGQLAERHGYAWDLRQEIKSGEELNNRPVMMGILKEIEAGKIHAIICQDFTRLSRDEDGIDGRIIRRACRDCGCKVITPAKVYDFSQDADHDMSDFEFLVGKLQKRANVRALTTGLKERARQGYVVGWKAKLGYRRVASDEMIKNKVIYWPEVLPEEAELVLLVFNTLLREGNPNAACRWLNRNGHLRPIKYENSRQKTVGPARAWRRKDIITVVSDEIYTGWLVYGRDCRSRFMADFEEQRHYHPELRIVDQDTFERCRQLLSSRQGKVPAKSKPYPFSGLLSCYCGGALVGRPTVKKGSDGQVWTQKIYDCSVRGNSGHGQCEGAKTITEKLAARTLIPFVARQLEGIGDNLRPALDEAAREMSTGGLRDRLIDEAQAELSEVERQSDNLARGVASGALAEDQARRTSLELADKRQRLSGKIEDLQQRIEIEAEFRRAIERLNGDVEAELWKMFENAPSQLGQLLRFIFEPASIKVRAYGTPRHRQAEIAEYRFTQDFASLVYVGSSSEGTLWDALQQYSLLAIELFGDPLNVAADVVE